MTIEALNRACQLRDEIERMELWVERMKDEKNYEVFCTLAARNGPEKKLTMLFPDGIRKLLLDIYTSDLESLKFKFDQL